MGSSGAMMGIVDDKIFVAVGKEMKESKSTLIWALHNSNGMKICIIYVLVPAKMIPMPMGGKFPANQVGEKDLKAFREKERQDMLSILDAYHKICTQVGARAEKMHIETHSTIEEGIVELISQQRIGKLVMGAATDRMYSRKMVEPKSRKAIYVRSNSPDYCHIWFVCKGYLIYTRKAVKQPILNIDEKLSNTPVTNQPEGGNLSQDLVSKLRFSDSDRCEGTSSGFGRSSEASFSLSSVCSEAESVPSSSSLSSVSGDSRELGPDTPESLVLPQSLDEHLGSSPPSVLESNINDHLYDQLERVMIEAENSRREAFEESMRRRKAEKETLDALCKVKTTERLYCEQLRQRKAIEGKLAKAKEELENTKNLWIKVSHALHEAMDQKLSLENQIEELSLSLKELEDKLFSAVELLQKYKNERDELQMERDNALKEAEQLKKELAQGPSSSHVPVFFLGFSFSDLEKATNYFDPSLKIGEGGYGSIYKGFLRHTEVAIKILNPNSMQGPREFDQEVDVLSKLRHPNMVTLVGACPESWALVYEYLPGGSLEDRLNCKDNTPPLSWQTRIRIATELCSVLIFLHSSRPSCVIHGDLKPSNILLDDNFVSKLSDFGICRVVSNGESTSMEQSRLLFTTEPKGTFTYMDPEYLSSGELTPQSDVYSFGIILLRLLTGRSSFGIAKEVEYALAKGTLDTMLDPSGGDWPFVQAEQLARIALRCCDKERMNRPDLGSNLWRVLEPMKASCQSSSMVRLESYNQAPTYFMCPIFQGHFGSIISFPMAFSGRVLLDPVNIRLSNLGRTYIRLYSYSSIYQRIDERVYGIWWVVPEVHYIVKPKIPEKYRLKGEAGRLLKLHFMESQNPALTPANMRTKVVKFDKLKTAYLMPFLRTEYPNLDCPSDNVNYIKRSYETHLSKQSDLHQDTALELMASCHDRFQMATLLLDMRHEAPRFAFQNKCFFKGHPGSDKFQMQIDDLWKLTKELLGSTFYPRLVVKKRKNNIYLHQIALFVNEFMEPTHNLVRYDGLKSQIVTF